jgi:hypothetical protein
MLEAHDTVEPNKLQSFLLDIMRNEKSDPIMKEMFAKVDDLMKSSIIKLLKDLLQLTGD